MNAVIATTKQMDLIKRGFREAVIAWYAHSGLERGEIVSLHRTMDAQQRILGRDNSGLLGATTVDRMTTVCDRYGNTLSAPESLRFDSAAAHPQNDGDER